MGGMSELPRGSCRGALQTANLRRVPLAIQVSRIPRLMGELSPVTSSHVPDPVPGEGNPRSTARAGTRSSARRAVSPNSQWAGRRTDHGANPSPAREGGSSAVDSSSKAPPLPNGASTAADLPSRAPSRGKWTPSAAFVRAASRALRVASRKWGGQESQLPQAATSALDGAVRRPIVATERRMGQRTKL